MPGDYRQILDNIRRNFIGRLGKVGGDPRADFGDANAENFGGLPE